MMTMMIILRTTTTQEELGRDCPALENCVCRSDESRLHDEVGGDEGLEYVFEGGAGVV